MSSLEVGANLRVIIANLGNIDSQIPVCGSVCDAIFFVLENEKHQVSEQQSNGFVGACLNTCVLNDNSK